MNLIESNLQVLEDLKDFLCNIDYAMYTNRNEFLYNASLGQHCRHIIEFYQCLIHQYQSGSLCYDYRQRQLLLEESPTAAADAISQIMDWLTQNPEDQALNLSICHDKESEADQNSMGSSLYRELAFNIEHAIHHMAIIKIGAKLQNADFEIPAHFGVAPSTIRHYRQQEPSVAG
jgi:uncharacterized damage-inducible protein DinB